MLFSVAMKNRGGNRRGFTLIELLAVICILGLLATFSVPVFRKVMEKADSTACASNLRQIGIAVQLMVQDNNGFYPNIEPDITQPIYQPEDNAMGLVQALAPFDVGPSILKCPADAKGQNYFAEKGLSYEWRPLVDGEPSSNPKLIFRRGIIIRASPTRIRLVTDMGSVHRGRQNALYADGHIKAY